MDIFLTPTRSPPFVTFHHGTSSSTSCWQKPFSCHMRGKPAPTTRTNGSSARRHDISHCCISIIRRQMPVTAPTTVPDARRLRSTNATDERDRRVLITDDGLMDDMRAKRKSLESRWSSYHKRDNSRKRWNNEFELEGMGMEQRFEDMPAIPTTYRFCVPIATTCRSDTILTTHSRQTIIPTRRRLLGSCRSWDMDNWG